MKLPEGWRLITQGFPFELNPNQTDAQLVSFLVPQTTLAGEYEVTYLIKDREYPSVRDFYTTYVIVLPVSKLQVKLLESPEYVIAGEEYQSSFTVINQGNAEYTMSTKVDSSENIPYVVDAGKFTLGPGQSRTVIVRVKTDPEATKELKHRLQLAAEVVGEGKATVQSNATSFVEIIPRISQVEDPFHRIPAEVTLRYVSQNDGEHKSGFQTEVQGEGTLDEEGEEHVKFRFRGPDVQDKAILGERDEYSLSYWTKHHELHFGDHHYSLSWLTEKYLYGRGLEGKLHISDDLSLGAYHMETRWMEPETEETAAYMEYLISDENKVGLNWLRKRRNGRHDNITSFEGKLKPFKDTEVELEYALGPGGTKKDNAYLTRLYGDNNCFSYYLKLTHAGPDYPGYYRDLDYVSGGVRFPIRKRLRLNASLRRERNNLDLDPVSYSAPLEKYYQFGLDYKVDANTTFSLDWLDRDRRDRLGSPKFDYQEDTLRVGVRRGFEKLSIHSSAEFGKTENKLDDTTSGAERYGASVYFQPNEKQSYRAYLHYDDNSDFTGENRRSTTVGLNARYTIASRTFLNLALQTNDRQGSALGDRDSLELSLSHTFDNRNRLSIIARQTRYRNSASEDETAVMVQYTIPLGLPVSPKKSVGSIRGYVYDEETQQAIGNIILRLNGFTAVTDGKGYFTFPSVKPGSYYLSVNAAAIGTNRISGRKTPIELLVQGGKKTWVEIPVTRAAWLSGRIAVYRYENNHNEAPLTKKANSTNGAYYISGNGSGHCKDAKLIEDYGLASAAVELSNSSETRRAVTDGQGHFELRELRPGKWTLKIYDDSLPEHHYIEQATFEIKLKPGERKEISARVLPRKRQIRIIAKPETVLEEEQN